MSEKQPVTIRKRLVGPYSLWLRVTRYGCTCYVTVGAGRVAPWSRLHRRITVTMGATWYRS